MFLKGWDIFHPFDRQILKIIIARTEKNAGLTGTDGGNISGKASFGGN